MKKIFFLSLFVVLFCTISCKKGNETDSSLNQTQKSKFEVDKEKLSIKELNSKGLKFYKQKKYDEAVKYFQGATHRSGKIDDGHGVWSLYLPACYNLSCTLSLLYSQKKYNSLDKILEYVSYVLYFDHSNKWRKKIDKDSDFNSIRNNEKFIQLLLFSDLRNSLINKNDEFLKKNIIKLKNKEMLDSFGHGLLFYAVKEENSQAVEILLDNGLDINKGFNYGSSPLVYLFLAHTSKSYLHDYSYMIEYYIKKGSDVNVFLMKLYEYEYFESYYAEMKGYNIDESEPVGYESGESETLLKIALFNRNEKLIKLLFDNNVNINVKINEGETVFKYVQTSGLDKYRMFVIELLKNHKDSENADQYIDFIQSRHK